jgi:hypothetical protein
MMDSRCRTRPASLLCSAEGKRASDLMATLEHEFYRSFRGPELGDEDDWCLAFDTGVPGLRILHRWQGKKHSGVAEFGLDEFLAQPGAARDALVSLLFDRETADA